MHTEQKRDRRQSEWSYYVGLDEIYHARWAASATARLHGFKEAFAHFWPRPESFPVRLIQVAGTSGKGSTCKFLQSGLSRYGRAGCYVKPHVFDYSERFTVEDGQVDHGEILEIWNEMVKPYASELVGAGRPALDHPEVSLLIALLIFQRHRLDWAAVETGVGGRYDPASTLDVVATVVTNVGRDHEEVLGSEHWQRALEKAGVCRRGIPLVLGDDNPDTIEVVRAACRDEGAPLLRVSRADVREVERALVRARNGRLEGIFDGSRHQLRNASVAMKVIKTLVKTASTADMAPKFLETEYVGRFWRIEDGVYADVAHNPSKTDALAKEIAARFPKLRKVFVIGISGSRNPVEVVGPLVSQAKAVVVTAAGYKGQDPEEVYSALRDAFPSLPIHLATQPRSTLKVARNLKDKADVIVFTGSTYMIDQALNPDERLRHLNGAYGWREQRQSASS